ncbi:MAG: monovalent cation/H+ antiporter subunit A [Burkholderiales bacterium]
MPLATLILLPFLASGVAALVPTHARNAASTLAGLVALVCLVQAALLFPEVQAGGVLREEYRWLPSAGLNIVIRLDGFAWLFSMLVLGIGALVVMYARYYMSPKDPVPRFFAFLLAFMGSMMGVVLSGNLVQLVLFWELTSLFSFLLIGYWHHLADARRGARMSLTVTGLGGICLLIGVLLIGHVVGSFDLDDVLGSGDTIRTSPLYPVLLVLVLLGALTKSAQFPFHFWLPHAMSAPTPVSAYLHSATMVKAGVFLLARLWPALSGTDLWFYMVGGAGLATLLLGAYSAMFQNDLKGLLAYSTISHLGLITLLLGLNSPFAAVAAVFHIMNHAIFKASLFMAAGIIDHETGSRDIRKLNGLWRSMPYTGTLALVAAASMAGVPLLNGFLSKEMFFAGTIFVSAAPWIEYGLPLAATVFGIFSVAYSLRFSLDVFFGPPSHDLPRQPHEPNRWMRVPVELLVAACLVVGLVPAWSIGAFLAAAARPVVGGDLPDYSLAIWHGFNLPFVMSLIALGGGAVGYLLLRRAHQRGRLGSAPLIGGLSGKSAFETALAATSLLARKALRTLGSRRLQVQLLLVVAAAALAAAAPLLAGGLAFGNAAPLPVSPVFLLLWVVGIACAVGAAQQAKFHRLVALILMAGAGLVTCVTFIWFSAPDLALTQLAVEVVTTVLILLGLRWLPTRVPGKAAGAAGRPRSSVRERARRLRDLALALSCGAGMSALAYAMLTREAGQSISPFFLERALPEGGGANVVNVLLVDFRAFDTLGELTVLGAVSLAVYALLRRFRPPRESIQRPKEQRASAARQQPYRLPGDLAVHATHPRSAPDTALGYLEVPAVLVRLMLPVALMVASYLFLRGHNEPGGGFVAGLVVATGLILQYVVSGTYWVEARLPLNPPRWIAVGLLLAAATGLGSLVLDYPLLTTHTAHFSLPLFGDIHLPSALLFDVGVFALVVGSTVLILTALAHQSVRRHGRARREEGAAATSTATAAGEGAG